jgi:hypothetical protein
LVNVDTEVLHHFDPFDERNVQAADDAIDGDPAGPRYIAGVSGVGEEVGEEVVGARPGAEVRESYRSSVFLQLRALRLAALACLRLYNS